MVSGKKNAKLPVKKEVPTVRSSAAEYLTFIAATGSGGVEAVYADESIWLTQKMMGVLYDVETHTINYHLKKVFSDSELQEDSVIRNFRITAADGKNYDTKHYKLPAIIAVGYKVKLRPRRPVPQVGDHHHSSLRSTPSRPAWRINRMISYEQNPEE
jgi:hypothetical protein